jgi:hypothetical protein
MAARGVDRLRTRFQPGTALPSTPTMLAALRIARRLHACLLLLFLCSVGAAVASPLFDDGAASQMSVVCSAQGGVKLVDGNTADAGTPVSHHKLDCPLCLPMGAALPTEFAVATFGAQVDAPSGGGPDAVRIPSPALRPPARAPPV